MDGTGYLINITGGVLPVELTSFSAATTSSTDGLVNVSLNWETATEVNNYGFEIERHGSTSLTMTSNFIPSGDEGWEKIGFVEGHGNSNSPKNYSFSDQTPTNSGKYYYRLKQIDSDGTYEYSNTLEVQVKVPSGFHLSQNYPNPFNPTSKIDFTLPEKQLTSLRVYNLMGELVSELINEIKEPGSYSVTFDASELPSGTYFYTISAGNFIESYKMTLIK